MLNPPPKIDSPLFPVIAKCLEKTPGKRFANFAELRAALEPLLMELTGETVSPPSLSEMNAAEWLNKGLSLKNQVRSVSYS